MTEHVDTPLGARLRTAPAYDHLGPGVILYLDMVDPADARHAEVYLDPASMAGVRALLTGPDVLTMEQHGLRGEHYVRGPEEWRPYEVWFHSAGERFDHLARHINVNPRRYRGIVKVHRLSVTTYTETTEEP
jgi:hypothetical protein